MLTWLANAWSLGCKFIKFGAAALALTLLGAASALADEPGGEAGLKLPDLSQVTFLGIDGHKLLLFGIVIVMYFGWLAPVHPTAVTLPIILIFSLVGIAGSYGVAWFGIRVNTFANSRTAFASLRGKPYPIYSTPLQAGMSIGMMLISVELLMMLFILLFIPGDYAGPCFIGFAIGESLR